METEEERGMEEGRRREGGERGGSKERGMEVAGREGWRWQRRRDGGGR